MKVNRPSRFGTLIGIAAVVFLIVAGTAIPAGAHVASGSVSKPPHCAMAVYSAHGSGEMWGFSNELVGPAGDCLWIKACIYWSYDAQHMSWGGTCRTSYVGLAAPTSTDAPYAQRSTHYGRGVTEPSGVWFGTLYH